MMRVAVDGVHFNVQQAGSGPPLVMLHGFTGSAETWSPFAASLRQRFRLLAIDLLGHGASDSPDDPDRYNMERSARDLLSLLTRLGVDRFNLLGYSMGGRLALHLAVSAPERIRTLTLESASPGIVHAEERAARRDADEALAALLEREGLEAFVVRWERQPLFASQARLPSLVLGALRKQRLNSNPIGLARSLRGAGAGVQEPLWDRLEALSLPTLLIVGELDGKYRDLSGQMAGLLPAATLAVVPGAGHAVHLEQPAAFERHIVHFLTGRSAIDANAASCEPGTAEEEKERCPLPGKG